MYLKLSLHFTLLLKNLSHYHMYLLPHLPAPHMGMSYFKTSRDNSSELLVYGNVNMKGKIQELV